MISARRLAVPALLVAAPLIFFHEVCLKGEIFLLRDLFNWFYPWRVFAANSLAAGELPLWNPYSYAGTPFLANMQSGLLYPPNAVFWTFDFSVALRLFLVIQFALAASFMYLLLRALKRSRPASLTGALGYAYGGWMIVQIEFPNKLAAAAWLPLILLGLIVWWNGRPWMGLAVGGTATACCITAGYPQTTFTLLLGAGVVWIVATGSAIRSRFGGRDAARAVSTAASLPLVVALGLLLAAAQVVPFLEATSQSARSRPMDSAQVLARGLAPTHLLDLVYPHIFGLPGYARYWGGDLYQFWLGHFYVGLITLVLALLAPWALRGDPSARNHEKSPGDPFSTATAVWAGVVLLILAGLFCLGDRTPLAPLCVAWLPGFRHIKWLATTSILIAFALCWLAAFGLQELTRRGRQPSPLLMGAWLAFTAAVAASGAAAWMAPDLFEKLVRAAVSPVVLPAQQDLIARNLDPLRFDAIRAGLLMPLLTVAWLSARSGRLRTSVAAGLVPVALFIDLKGAAAGINHTTDPAIYSETPRSAGRLKSSPDPLFRLFVPASTLSEDRRMYGATDDERFRWAANTMLFNLNLPHGLFSGSDGDPLGSRRTWRFHRSVEAAPSDQERRRLLAAYNVGYVLQDADQGGTEVAEVPGYHPRVYAAAGARRVEPEEALRILAGESWDPHLEALVESDYTGAIRPASADPLRETVHSVLYRNNSVAIDIEVSRDCYLVLADTIYPGWKATVDARDTPLFTVNYLYRGVELPAGRHQVLFAYGPASFRWGLAGSLGGLLALAGAILLDSRRRGGRLEDHLLAT